MTTLDLEDAMNLWEIATVNRYNEALAAEYANRNNR